ncbi:MAG: hypothetical protein QOE60_977 [Thermoleophilaceae bacterium]|nr:hypothetical protein [Thermoleophilaceae bacterium]
MPELERRLTRLADDIEWPETPDLAGRVMDRLEAEPAEGRPPRLRPPRLRPARLRPARLRLAGPGRTLVLAAVFALLLAGTVFAAVPGVRHAVLDFLGLRGATVERRQTLPTPPPERPLDLGTRMTLAEAGDRLGFAPLVPQALGPPDAVYVRRGLPGGELSLAYRPRPGLPRARSTRLGALLSEFRGDLAPEYLGKLAGPDTKIERLTVDDNRAIWIEGAPHFLMYRDPGGAIVESSMRIAQNALLLERGRLLIRLEGAFGRERALGIAGSLR